MINYIKYTVDGKTYDLISNGDGTWSKEATAPNVAGNYNLLIEISENGNITFVDSTDPRYNVYLDVIVSTERVVFLEKHVPDIISEISDFKVIFDSENLEFDKLRSDIEEAKYDMFIVTSSNDAITRRENFIRMKGIGNLEQRKNYLISLNRKGNKLSESSIKNITNAITGSDCIVMFFGSDEPDNPEPGYSLLRVQVLSPDATKNYRYEDISRVLRPLIPSHIKLSVIRFFATWGDVNNNYTDWISISNVPDWKTLNNFLPPR